MNLERIGQSLQTLFADDRRWSHRGRRLVFWYDPGGEFVSAIDQISVPGVSVARVGNTPFALKRQLLVEDPDTPYLLYSPNEEPPAAENWLLDLQLTGVKFTADRAAMIFADLGFLHRPLEGLIRDHSRFFRSEKRLNDLRALNLPPQADEDALLTGLLAVAVRVREAEGRAIVRQVLLGGLDDGNSIWQDVGRLGLEDAFWSLARSATGFGAETTTLRRPTLRQLFIALLLAHLAHQSKGNLPPGLDGQVPTTTTPGYSVVAAWMRDSRDHARLRSLIDEVEGDLGIAQWAASCELSALRGIDTFPALEPVALRGMVAALGGEGRPEEIGQLARERLELHYAGGYRHEYQAVIAAADFLARREQFAGPFPGDALALLEGYVSDWHGFDRLYRAYITASDGASRDLLSALTERIEHLYVEWFQSELNRAWTDAFDPSLASRLDARRRQWEFYRWRVQPLLERNDRDRVVVIVSDALRYEVATELRESLLADLRGEAQLGSMLSVLPSQTRWGMAALLPGEELAWDGVSGRVLRGGLPTNHADRAGHLARTGYPSVVMKLDELAAMSTEEARAALEGKRLVYLYHDAIDALGDKLASERDVFAGCAAAVAELGRAIRRLVNSLNSSTVLVTADHGFLYQRRKIKDADKLDLPRGPGVSANRRAAVAEELPEEGDSLRVQLDRYQPMSTPLQGLFPRGTLRYRVQGGGAGYVHGGASLQEMVVPVLTYRHRRSSPGTAQASRKVGVELVSRSRRVTNNVFNVTLVQAEAVAERLRPRTVTVQMLDGGGNPVTDQKTVILASASPHPAEREQNVRLSVTIPDPDEHADYFLTVTDDEDSTTLIRETWAIRIAFKDDFGF